MTCLFFSNAPRMMMMMMLRAAAWRTTVSDARLYAANFL